MSMPNQFQRPTRVQPVPAGGQGLSSQQAPAGIELSQEQQEEQKKIDQFFDKFRLIGNDGWVDVAKWIVAVVLGYWNLRFFTETIAGWEGWFTGACALCLEGTVIYCMHYYPRSAGAHKTLMFLWFCLLGLFSLTHAALSVIHHTGYIWPSPRIVNFYSHVIALPLCMVLILASTASLKMSHWAAAVSRLLGQIHIKAAIRRSTQKAHMLQMAHQLEESRMASKVFEGQTDILEEIIPVIQRRSQTEQTIANMIATIPDQNVQRRMRDAVEQLRAEPTIAKGSQGQLTRP